MKTPWRLRFESEYYTSAEKHNAIDYVVKEQPSGLKPFHSGSDDPGNFEVASSLLSEDNIQWPG